MEDLKQLMQLIDEHSHSLPEGDYMKMCQNMKNLFPVIKNKPEYELPDPEDPDSYSGGETWLDGLIYENRNAWGPERPHQDPEVERVLLHMEYNSIGVELKDKKNELKLYGVIQNATRHVKTKSVKDYCRSRFLSLPEYTFKKLIETYPQCFPFDNTSMDVFAGRGTLEQLNKRYTKKLLKCVERHFYNEYINRQNDIHREHRETISYDIDRLLEKRLFISYTYSSFGFTPPLFL